MIKMDKIKNIQQNTLANRIFKPLNLYFISSIIISSLIIIFQYSLLHLIAITITTILASLISSFIYGVIFYMFGKALLSLEYHKEEKFYSTSEIKQIILMIVIIISTIYGLIALFLGIENLHDIILKSYIMIIVFYLIQKHLFLDSKEK